MRRSIRWRMVSIFVLLVVIVMMASGTLIVFQTRNYEKNLIEEDMNSDADSIVGSLNLEQPVEEIENQLITIMATSENRAEKRLLILLDTQGRIIKSPDSSVLGNSLFTPSVMSVLSGSQANELNEMEDGVSIELARGVYKDGQLLYVVYILADTDIVQEKIQAMAFVILLAVLLAIVLSVVLAFLFSNFLTKPIYLLTLKAREMAKGELDNPIDVVSNDEIGELTSNFNSMAFSLNETLAEIASEKNKMETVITHMTDGILVFDNFGILMHKNPAAIRMMKLGNVLTFRDVFKGKLDMDYQKLLQNVEYETQTLSVTQYEQFYSLDFAKYMDKDGTILGLICVIQDITEHKKLENMQKEFVANVSHELRTPLTTIKSYAETLLEGAVDDLETTNSFLGVINSESDRMTALVKDLLELSRIDNKKTVLEESVIDLKKLVHKSVENYRIHAEKKNQRLTLLGEQDEYIVMGDGNRIEQVVKNLLSNAVKYSEDKAEIDVKLFSDSRYHIVQVTDTGMGIPDEDLEHIFDRFYRVDKARSRAMGGTGLGLAIAKEIMELHKGQIKVESEINEGTVFTLYFPQYEYEEEFDDGLDGDFV